MLKFGFVVQTLRIISILEGISVVPFDLSH